MRLLGRTPGAVEQLDAVPLVAVLAQLPPSTAMLRRLRSTSWDGPPPLAGDVLVTAQGPCYRVYRAAAGAGVGQYSLDVVLVDPATCEAARVFAWRER